MYPSHIPAKDSTKQVLVHSTERLIHNALDVLLAPDGVVELRIPNVPRHKTVSGFFDDRAALCAAARQWEGKAEGVYVTLNPVQPALLARRANRVEPYADHLTGDAHIERRRWFLVDFDAAPVAGISTTDVTIQAAGPASVDDRRRSAPRR